ncbi:uncharacterized protein LOC131029200 isoform X2 [Cryptomeria japonica]|uniref:uncharacterized protein LOC131029200 isoform X2 n=1 Tax=Cryptomeria japonica TaxID=3369 RepID=UPI0027DA57BD|nr:uncharacterized protein LOC131029200 isoform X2 [Cryptomeria japonica]XP_059072957.1 uncharacterized protein LOC131029200 isoform X2 [Cryptomeria japonica]
MEEDKAVAYYDELARKGGGAARFKQGLGFSSHSSQEPPSKGNTPSALSNFVKAASPSRAEAIGKEIQIENIREKLKRRGENVLEQHKGRDGAKSQHSRQEGRSFESRERDRSRSLSPKRINEKSHERDGKHSRHRDYRSRSPYDKHRRHRSRSGGRSSKHSSKRSCRRSYSRSNRNRSTSSDRSRNHHRHRRASHQSSSTSSSSQSHNNNYRRKKRRERSISFSCSEDEGRSPPYYSRKRGRGRSRSPASRRDYSKERTRKLDKSLSPRQQRTTEECLPHRNRKIEEAKLTGRQNGKETSLKSNASSLKEKAQIVDYSKLIDGFDAMTPAEKVKAKMRLQLSETAGKDTKKGMSEDWERFDFNKEAPLDDDAKLDYFGDDTGAKDDTEFLRNTGTTFLSSAGQAKRESEVQAAHEAAIFGTHIHSSADISNLYPTVENTLQEDQNQVKITCIIESDIVEDKGSKGVLNAAGIMEGTCTQAEGAKRK